jgi:hypothetical protein
MATTMPPGAAKYVADIWAFKMAHTEYLKVQLDQTVALKEKEKALLLEQISHTIYLPHCNGLVKSV